MPKLPVLKPQEIIIAQEKGKNPNARDSRNALIWGYVFGVLDILWLFVVMALLGFSGRPDVGSVILNVLPVIVPVGLLVFGVLKGLKVNREIRENRRVGDSVNEKLQGTSLVAALLILIILFFMILGITRTVATCLQAPLQCSFY